MSQYKLKADRLINGELCASAGDTVYRCVGHDYGGASDDTRITGAPHMSVTLDPDGGYPFFTVPVADLDRQP